MNMSDEIELTDNDYFIAKDHAGVWIRVDNISVWVRRTDEGVVVDLWSKESEMADEPIASAYAFFSEAAE
jgi:hypothetical protein